jgi:peptide/nickel transport system permease protein
MNILSIIGRRAFYAVALILAVIVLNFILIHLAPGDPAEVIAGEMGGATAEILADIRKTYGLDKPLHEQLGLYLYRFIQGDMGQSLYYNTPVKGLILDRIGPTILLVVTALVLAMFVGTFLGVTASLKPNGITSALVTILSLVGYSAPVFWTAIMLVILFAWLLPIFPISGMATFGLSGGVWVETLDILHHLVLPAFALAIIYIAQYSRITRASMLEVLGADYIRTARAKGLSETLVIYKHALRNAILPVITLAGLQFGNLISGAVLIETVFNWPGLGTLAYDSILARDYPTILGLLFFSSLITIVANLVTDLCYRLADPRIKSQRQR